MKVWYDANSSQYMIAVTPTDTVPLTPDDAVHIVKELYRLGLEFDMPSADSYLQGKLEATEKHLEDLRRLVMDGIAPEKK